VEIAIGDDKIACKFMMMWSVVTVGPWLLLLQVSSLTRFDCFIIILPIYYGGIRFTRKYMNAYCSNLIMTEKKDIRHASSSPFTLCMSKFNKHLNAHVQDRNSSSLLLINMANCFYFWQILINLHVPTRSW
jgi:hypothetical protein